MMPFIYAVFGSLLAARNLLGVLNGDLNLDTREHRDLGL